jgi:uncharacterized protein YodC (DUF2158 family)
VKKPQKPRCKALFKVGAVVHSGVTGVPMTVEDCDKKHVGCRWFGINGSAQWTGPHYKRFRPGEVVRGAS